MSLPVIPDYNVDTGRFASTNPSPSSNPKEILVEQEVHLPKCKCGKTPLRCPHPDNCLMENL